MKLKQIIYYLIFMFRNWFLYLFNFYRFNKLNNHRFSLKWSDRYPCIKDATANTNFDRHYVYHTAWAIRKLKEIKPKKHIDIASSLYFPALASAFIPIEFYDYRPAKIELSGLKSKKGDLLNLPFKNESVESLSCMHTIEHVGLGRYGDKLDPDGDLKAIAELKRVIEKNGSLLFVVPIGKKAKIMYNAHRIYTVKQIKSYFTDLKLKEFCLISEDPKLGIIKNPDKKLLKKQTYACGCFWFVK
ncbi:DUF268 domain-containing protein [Candidatus Beckwithbacteria bacterium]|nr:DUF268 domain-containing protein [Candidatus Beckwithbacteria bacterium]